MRIHLRPQRFQFRVPRQNPRLECALLRLARRLLRQQHVVERHRQNVQQNSRHPQQWEILCGAFVQSRKPSRTRKPRSQRFRQFHPQRAQQHRRRKVREQQLEESRRLHRRRPARIPRRQTKKRIHKTKRHRKCRCHHPTLARPHQQIDQDSSQRNPCQQIQTKLAKPGKYGMHFVP